MGPVSHVFCATAQGRLAKLMSRKTHVSTPIYFCFSGIKKPPEGGFLIS